MATYRFIDYNQLSAKPADVDMFAIYDIDDNELKKFSYATMKAQFVKVDEATDVTHTVEFQSTGSYPNAYLKFGNSGEFQQYSDGTDFFLKGTNATGKLRFYANSTEMLTVDPVNASFATWSKAISRDGTALKGIYFDSNNDMVLYNKILCTGAGIALVNRNISYTAASNTGLEFNAGNDATFKQDLTVDGVVTFSQAGASAFTVAGEATFSDQIRMGSNIDLGTTFYLSPDGSAKGLHFDAYGITYMVNGAQVSGGDLAVTADLSLGISSQLVSIGTGDVISINGNCKIGTGKVYKIGATSGWSGTINIATDNTITVLGGLVTAKS